MKYTTIHLTDEQRAILSEIMTAHRESKPAAAARRALESYLGVVEDNEPASSFSITITRAADTEIKRRGLSYAEAMRRALNSYFK